MLCNYRFILIHCKLRQGVGSRRSHKHYKVVVVHVKCWSDNVFCKSPSLKYLDNLRDISARRNPFLDLLDAASSKYPQRGTLPGTQV